MSCGIKLEARRNADFRVTFSPSSRRFTFSGMVPLFTVRLGDAVLLQVGPSATPNGSNFVVAGNSVVLTLEKADLAALDSAAPDTSPEVLFFDVVLTDETGFENWLTGGQFILLGINDLTCGGCRETVEISLGGQCVEVVIEGGNLAAGADVTLQELNEAAARAEQAAADAEAAAASIPAMVANKADTDGGNIAPVNIQPFRASIGVSAPDLASLKNAKITDSIFVGGRAAPGDGYAGDFEWIGGDRSADVTADPRQAVWVAPAADPTGASGAWKRALADGVVDLVWFDVVGDGATDETEAVQSWISLSARIEAIARGVYGTFLVDQITGSFTKDLVIDLSSGCTIKGAAGFSTAVIEIDGGVASPNLIMRGGCIDNTLRDYVPATASGTGLYVKRFHVDIRNVRCVGDRANSKGDSGIGTLECTGVIDNCVFIGQPDIGIYNTGGGSIAPGDDYGDFTVSNCRFVDCEIGLTFRRQSNRVFAEGNKFIACGAGIQSSEAQSGAVWIPGAKVVVISGNMGQSISGAFIDVRAAAPGSQIVNNTCTDWGVSASAACYGILGCQGVRVAGNSAILATVTPVTHSGVSVNNYTDGGGTLYEGRNNSIGQNYISGANVGIRDLSTGPNFYQPNAFLSLTGAGYVGVDNAPVWTEGGLGIGVAAPLAALHVSGAIRVDRPSAPLQFATLSIDANGTNIESWSDPAAAKSIRYMARTDAANTAPTGGVLDHIFYSRTAEQFRVRDAGSLTMRGLTADPGTPNNGDIWRRSDLNQLRVRLGTTTYSLNVTAV